MPGAGRGTKMRKPVHDAARRGARTDKTPPVARKHPVRGPAVCGRCGATFVRDAWRRGLRTAQAGARVRPTTVTTCPACVQVSEGHAFGKVVLRGAFVFANEDAIRRRLANVAERAAFTQPERRIVSVARDGATLEVLTTSQKLAHRIGRELVKGFGGRSAYAWSDRDGSLLVTWVRDDVAEKTEVGRRPRPRAGVERR